jgi:heat shock protein HslJ
MALSHVGAAVWLATFSTAPSAQALDPAGFRMTLRCAGYSQATGGTQPPVASQTAPGPLEGVWNVVELYGTAVAPDAASPDRQPHLVFGAEGRLSGADGCNRLTGPYTIKGNGITFGEIAGTRMACPKTDEIAKRLLAALKGTSHWSIVNDRLEFYGATGKPLAVLERRAATAGGAQPDAASKP